MSTGGRSKNKLNKFIAFRNYGLFYRVGGEDLILLHYLLNINIKNEFGYIYKDNIDKVLLVLDKLNINYLFNKEYYNFENNQYDYYLEYAYKKYDLYLIINGVYHD